MNAEDAQEIKEDPSSFYSASSGRVGGLDKTKQSPNNRDEGGRQLETDGEGGRLPRMKQERKDRSPTMERIAENEPHGKHWT